MNSGREPVGDLGDEIIRRGGEMPPEAPVQRIQPRPQGQPQQDHGHLATGAGALGGRHQAGEDAILLVAVAREVVKVIEQRARVDEAA